MNEPTTPTSRLAATFQGEMEALERALAAAELDAANWKARALDAEASRDRYAHFCVELITRAAGLSQLASIISHCVHSLVADARRVATNKPNEIPAQPLVLPAEDQERLDGLVRMFDYRPPGTEEDPS